MCSTHIHREGEREKEKNVASQIPLWPRQSEQSTETEELKITEVL